MRFPFRCLLSLLALVMLSAPARAQEGTPDLAPYPWIQDLTGSSPALTMLETRFSVPAGYKRVPVVALMVGFRRRSRLD